MASFLKYARSLVRIKPKTPLTPLQFPTTGFEVISDEFILEEEHCEKEFKGGKYCPVNIGDVFASKYQVLGKLGFGVTSTVWLARNLQDHEYATLKVFTREDVNNAEFDTYKLLSQGNRKHPGYPYVRTALDIFTIPRLGGDHQCLVQNPMWDSFKDLLNRNPAHRLTEEILKAGLVQVFFALDYLHSECKLIHTDIKADNLLIELDDDAVLESFTKAELEYPSPRKFVDGTTVYARRKFNNPKSIGNAVLGDFGSTVSGAEVQNSDVQPNVYRSPEVMLNAEWSYPIDIWNVGCMIWDIFEDKHLFYGNDPDGSGYKTRAHLAEVVGMLGLPPLDLLKRGARSHLYFGEDGKWVANLPIPDLILEKSEENYEGNEKDEFLRFMRCMLQWRPEDRKTAKQLLEDPWLQSALE